MLLRQRTDSLVVQRAPAFYDRPPGMAATALDVRSQLLRRRQRSCSWGVHAPLPGNRAEGYRRADGPATGRTLAPKCSLRLVSTIEQEGFRFAGGHDERGGLPGVDHAIGLLEWLGDSARIVADAVCSCVARPPGDRVRVGDYGIMYTVVDDVFLVVVVALGHRRDVYEH